MRPIDLRQLAGAAVLAFIALNAASSERLHLSDKEPDTALVWETDYDAAVARAKKEDRPMLIFETEDHCGWCKRLEQTTFSNRLIAKLLQPFILVQAKSDKKVEAKFPVSGYPTLHFVTKDEQQMHSISGYRAPGPFLKEGVAAYEKLGLKLPEEIQTIAAKTVEIDLRQARALAREGKADELYELLKKIDDDPLADSQYLIACFDFPAGFDRSKLITYPSALADALQKSDVALTYSGFKVLAPGFEVVLDASAFTTSRVLKKQYALKPLTAERAAKVSGVVRLPDGKPARGATVRVLDWAITKTDEQGRYEITNVAPGLFEIRAEMPGYESYFTHRLESGDNTLPMDLTATTTISIRWAYQTKEGVTDLNGPDVETGEATFGLNHSRFSLHRGADVGPAYWGSDFMLEEIEPGVPMFWLFDATSRRTGLHRVATPYDEIQTADPYLPYEFLRAVPVRKGDVYLVKCVTRDCLAKLEIVDVTIRPNNNAEQREPDTALREAVRSRNLEAVKKLVEQGAKVNEKTSQSCTALGAAIVAGDLEIIKFLIDHGANVNQASYYTSPLKWAENFERAEIEELLRKAGAKREVPDDN